MNENKNHDWKTLYMDALCELDEVKLLPKIDAALNRIRDLLEGALDGQCIIDSKERRIIEDARVNLRHLQNV